MYLTIVHSECQKDDWVHGTPRPHKTICGKRLDEDTINQPRQSTKSNLPPPDPGHKRSIALLHQMSVLTEFVEQRISCDYLVRLWLVSYNSLT